MALLLVALLLGAPLALAGGASVTLLPRNGDPDVPASSAPVAVVTAFEEERWSFTGGVRTRDIVVPDVEWDRVVLVFTVDPKTDPWDRLFGIGIDGTEVLHGATVRAPMTLRRDVTAYAELLPPGATVPIQHAFDSWVGYQLTTVRLEFYHDPATSGLVEPRHDTVVSPFFFRGLGGPGTRLATTATFPETAPQHGLVELTTSGHGQEGEFFFLHGTRTPPTFVILVDGAEIGRATALPYVYALAGLGGGSVVTTAAHGAVWWTAQQGLDVAGVHTGTGEIPAYRAELPPETLASLTGERSIEVVVEGGQGGYWPTSVTFLLDDG